MKEGWGFCLVSHTSSISSLEGLTGSAVNCLPDGSVILMTGTTDMGQGAETALTQVCAEKLGMDFNDVRHAALDTSTSPYNIGSYSSGQMYLTGNAVAQACEVVIGKARTGLAKLYRIPEEKIVAVEDESLVPNYVDTKGIERVYVLYEIDFVTKGKTWRDNIYKRARELAGETRLARQGGIADTFDEEENSGRRRRK